MMDNTIALTHAAIRPARDSDGDGIAALMARIWADYPGTVFDRATELPELDAPASHYRALGGNIWVLCSGAGTVLGSVAVTPGEDKAAGEWELHKLYLDHALRGTGWAARLIGVAEDLARASGGHSLGLWTDTRFVAAHRFYTKMGYQRQPGDRLLQDLSASREYAFVKRLV